MPTVTIDGEPVEVEASAITYGDDEAPDGYVHQDDVDGIVKRRLARRDRTLKSDLQESDEFWQQMAEARGVELREDGKPKGSLKDEEVEALRKKASKVESLSTELEQLRAEQDETRRTQLQNAVLTTVDGVHENAKDDLLAAVERQMTYDDDYGWVATDGDGNIQYSGGEPIGVEGVTTTLRENKPYFFKSQSMSSGPPSDHSGGGAGGKRTWTADEYEAAAKRTHEMDEDTYRDWETAPDEGRVTD